MVKHSVIETLTLETTEQYVPETIDAPLSQEVVFDALFDSFIQIADGPEKIARRAGTDRFSKNPIFEYDDRDLVAKMRLEDLHRYVRTSFVENGLTIDPNLIPKEGPISIDSLIDVYVAERIVKARQRAATQGKLASHVTATTIDVDPEVTHGFKEIVSKSFAWIKNPTVHFHSGEIPVASTESIPASELKEYIK